REVLRLDRQRSRSEIVMGRGPADARAGQPELSGEIGSYRTLQASEAVVTEALSEADDGGAARSRPSRQVGDRAEGNGFGIVEHDGGHAALGWSQRVAALLEPIAHGHERTTYPDVIVLERMFRIWLCRNGGTGEADDVVLVHQPGQACRGDRH